MRRKIMIIGIAFGALLVAMVIGGTLLFSGFGKASYVPGNLAAAAAAGRLSLEPSGRLAYGAPRPAGGGLEGTVEPFRVEVEGSIVLEGFARGRGKPVLVLHGGPGFPSDSPWAGLGPFEDRYRFYYWHQRGSGRSTRPIDRFATRSFPAAVAELEARLGLSGQVADVERLRRAIGAERVDLVGHSFGGFVACLAAVEFPSSFGRLLLVAPAPLVVFPAASGGLYEEIRRALPKSELPAYEKWLRDFFDYGRLLSRSEGELAELNAGMIPFYAKAMAARGLSPAQAAGIPARTDARLVGGWMMQAAFFSMGRRHDWSAAFARISTPATLVYGSLDLTEAGSFDQYRVIPGLRIEQAAADHFVMDDREAFAEAASDFFE